MRSDFERSHHVFRNGRNRPTVRPYTLCAVKATSRFLVSYSTLVERFQVAPLSAASPLAFEANSLFSSLDFASGCAALLAENDCSKSRMISSICSVPTDIRIRSSVTPLSAFSSWLSCSWVVLQGWIASVLESPTLEPCQFTMPGKGRIDIYFARFEMSLKPSTT